MSAYAIKLFDSVGAENLIDFHELLVEAAFESADEYLLDGEALCRLDTAGLQLLLYFIHDVEAANKKVAWCNIPPAIAAQVRALGLSHVMKLQ